MNHKIAYRLSSELAFLGIEIDTSKEWQYWRKNNQTLNLHNEDPLDIARQVSAALIKA